MYKHNIHVACFCLLPKFLFQFYGLLWADTFAVFEEVLITAFLSPLTREVNLISPSIRGNSPHILVFFSTAILSYTSCTKSAYQNFSSVHLVKYKCSSSTTAFLMECWAVELSSVYALFLDVELGLYLLTVQSCYSFNFNKFMPEFNLNVALNTRILCIA